MTTTYTETYKVKRICAGEYEVVSGDKVVSISKVDGEGWIAAANWDRHLYTDYVPTKADAVNYAVDMLIEG